MKNALQVKTGCPYRHIVLHKKTDFFRRKSDISAQFFDFYAFSLDLYAETW